MITLSIDVTLLDKTKFKHITRKNGNKAVFCDLVLFNAKDTKYGDYIVKQGVSKEDRAAGVNMPICGNGKKVVTNGQTSARPEALPSSDGDSGVPF